MLIYGLLRSNVAKNCLITIVFMSYHPYIIEVSGNIIAKEGKNYTQGWTASSKADINLTNALTYPSVYDENKHMILGNLVLDKKTRAVPYATFFARGDVGITDETKFGTDLYCSPGFFPAFAYFKEYIKEIEDCLKIVVGDEIKELYYNGLYISAFSVLELFLCDFLLCGVFANDRYYTKALIKLKIKDDSDQYKVEKAIKDTVNRRVYHRFRDVEKLFIAIFDFGFPNYDELKKQIYRRHNIVHRYALSNRDRMTVCAASHEDVAKLIESIVGFVDDMMNLCGLCLSEKEYLMKD